MTRTPRKRPPVTGVVVYQRGRKWAYRLELERDTLTGDRQWEYKSGFGTDEEAWSAAIAAKTAADAGRRVPPSKRTVADFLAEWLTAVRHSVKPSTYTNYVDYRDAYVVRIIGKRRLQDIDVPTLNELYRHLLREGRCKRDTNAVMYDYWRTRKLAGVEPPPREIAQHSGASIYAARAAVLRYRRGRLPVAMTPGLAPKTVKNVHRMLHRALSDAVAWGYLTSNPAVHASLPRERRTSARQRGKTWTAEELNAWLKVATKDRDAALWVLVATTGMRRSELAGADVELLDLAAARLTVEDTRVVVDGKAEESDGKTASGRRTIALDPLTVSYLRRHLAMLADEKREFGTMYRDHGKLFCHPDGRPIHPDTITRRFNRLVDRAEVPLIRLHDVRHTYATLSLDAGVEPKVVADRIGHANMAYTLTIYTHRSTGRDQPAADKVAGVIFGDAWQLPEEPEEDEEHREDDTDR
ncbi:tyrosine-type recombinase/integrase [Krasilnikovia sp. M28-CT-15]|uniref:tyrosine-type recombinase/integrase n=1 Tax=Krasilnikovia sp. M28-CT-15 TaxID=3373540 RepID=UPI0038768D12